MFRIHPITHATITISHLIHIFQYIAAFLIFYTQKLSKHGIFSILLSFSGLYILHFLVYALIITIKRYNVYEAIISLLDMLSIGLVMVAFLSVSFSHDKIKSNQYKFLIAIIIDIITLMATNYVYVRFSYRDYYSKADVTALMYEEL